MVGYSKILQCGPKKQSVTQRNVDANKLLDAEYSSRGIDYCEAQIAPDCLKREVFSFGEKLKLSYAHRLKRIKYRAHPELLHSFMHTVRACIPCHMIMEASAKITREVFFRCRGAFSEAALLPKTVSGVKMNDHVQRERTVEKPRPFASS